MKVLATLLLIATSVVSAHGSESELDCLETLIVLPGATEIHCHPYHGTYQVSYLLEIEHPASEAISALGKGFRSQSWLPVAEDVLNPGRPSSHVSGWTEFVDGTTDADRFVHQWMGSWVNLDGEIITYVLRYTYPFGGEKQLDELSVVGIYFPSETARESLAFSLSHNGNDQ